MSGNRFSAPCARPWRTAACGQCTGNDKQVLLRFVTDFSVDNEGAR